MSAAEELRQAAALMRERAEADGSRGWFAVDFNEGDDPAYRPLWGVTNDAFCNPPDDEDEPWLAVEVHTGTKATADYIAAMNPTVALAFADLLEDLADADAVRRPSLVQASALKAARAYLA